MTTFNWVSVSDLTRDEMCGLAKDRALVLLVSGATARLVRWPGTRPREKKVTRGQRARVEIRPGAPVTIPAAAVVAVNIDPSLALL